MNSWRSRVEVAATSRTLDSATIKRIQWLFERVCRHGYGAEQSLRTAVEIGATRMSAAGASRQAIRAAIAACVRGQPAEDCDRSAFLTGESRVLAIRRRMADWADGAVVKDVPAMVLAEGAAAATRVPMAAKDVPTVTS